MSKHSVTKENDILTKYFEETKLIQKKSMKKILNKK